MSAEEFLRSTEEQAGEGVTPIVFTGKGKELAKNSLKIGGKIKKFGAVGFVTVALVAFLFIFSAGNLIPAAIANRLLEETDVQYADAVQSKEIVFQEALREGDIPDNTTEILQSNGVSVGYLDADGNFVESNQHDGGLVLKMGSEVITADDFISKVNTDVNLYNSFNSATYSRSAYWYDDSAKEVMKAYGTTRNNYTNGESFDEVMEKKLGSGSNISINNVQEVEVTSTDEDGETHTSTEYSSLGSIDSSSDATELIKNVAEKSKSSNSVDATLNAADELKVADTISKEQRSGLFYLLFMENISKMQAGDGNESKINEAMNYIYESSTTEVVDVETGELIEVTGTALESPSMYSVLSGEKLDVSEIENYSNDRILQTIENKVEKKNTSIGDTITSAANGVKGAIGRFFGLGDSEAGDTSTLNSVANTVSSSLSDNSYSTIKGISAGEMLVEGAESVGKSLAKYSGATGGDDEAVSRYIKLNSDILAMDAAADRLNRSPFDITSKNTFLGSIIYKFAVGLYFNKSSSIFTGVSSFMNTTTNSLASLMGVTYADQDSSYLSNSGNCETLGGINEKGSPHCVEVAVFDTSTLNNPLNNPEYLNFVSENVDNDAAIGDSVGSSVIKVGSKLAGFIKNNIRRVTPAGITDGGILSGNDDEATSTESVPFISDLHDIIISWFNSTFNTDKKKAATGELFANTANNTSWSVYKWAQRYVSLARAQESLRQYAVNYDGRVAYNIKTLEGDENPVIAFIMDYCSTDTELAEK